MENSLKIAVLLGLMVQLCYPLQVGYKNCGSSAKIEDIDISPCESTPCILHKGESYRINVTFTAAKSTNKVRTVAHAMVGFMSMQLPVPADSCEQGRLACPIKEGTTVTYSEELEIAPKYPSVSFKAKWEIRGDRGRNLVCFTVPLQIKG